MDRRIACLLLCMAHAACATAPTNGVFEVRVTGDDYRWNVTYPGADGRLDTVDDVLATRDVSLPAGTEARILLESRDYLYTLALPHLGLKEIAVPDLVFELRLPPSEPGTFELLGDQLCGYDHPDLIGKLIVRPADEFDAWLQAAGDRP